VGKDANEAMRWAATVQQAVDAAESIEQAVAKMNERQAINERYAEVVGDLHRVVLPRVHIAGSPCAGVAPANEKFVDRWRAVDGGVDLARVTCDICLTTLALAGGEMPEPETPDSYAAKVVGKPKVEDPEFQVLNTALLPGYKP
jgi:hypothetical protein